MSEKTGRHTIYTQITEDMYKDIKAYIDKTGTTLQKIIIAGIKAVLAGIVDIDSDIKGGVKDEKSIEEVAVAHDESEQGDKALAEAREAESGGAETRETRERERRRRRRRKWRSLQRVLLTAQGGKV